MGYLLSINTSRRNKLPKDTPPAEWGRYNDAFRNTELTHAGLARHIRAGYAIAAQHNGRRKRENWRLAQHVGIDIDDGTYTWDELVHMPLIDKHAAIVHTTASHTPQHPRYRVLFLLEEPIRNPDEYTRIVRAFLAAFGTADEHCTDAARLFFGAVDCSLLLMPDNVVTAADLADIMATWGDSTIVEKNSTNVDFVELLPPLDNSANLHDKNGVIIPPDELSPLRRANHIDALLAKIRTAPDGAKWATLRDVSITLGGYAAAGYYDAPSIRLLLRQAIETRRATVASMPHAYNTIDSGLAHGAMRPLWYTRDNASGIISLSDAPPTDARGRLRRILDSRRVELETAILAADMNTAPDFDALVHEYALVQDRLATG